jgi:hypothetical protein
MRHRIPTAALAALAATLILAGTALAGGWANAVMDEPPPPDPPSAGEPITIGFTLLQHGVTPVNDPAPTVTVRNAATGEELSVIATQEGASGHWVAVITFPSDGTWRYEVTHELIVGMNGFNPVTVGSVAPAAPAASTATSAVAAQPLATLVLALLLTLAIAAAYILSRRRADRYRTVRA